MRSQLTHSTSLRQRCSDVITWTFGGGGTLSLDLLCWLGKDECCYNAQTAARFYFSSRRQRPSWCEMFRRSAAEADLEPVVLMFGSKAPGCPDLAAATGRTTKHTFALTLLRTSPHFNRVWKRAEYSSALESLGCAVAFLPVLTLISLYTNWFEPRKEDRLYLSALWVTADDSRQI